MHQPDLAVHGRHIEADGVSTFFLDVGTGQPLVLIHGGGAGADSWGNWKDVIPALGEGFRVIAVDMLGFGRTGKPDAGFVYSQDARNRHLAAFLRALELDAPVVVGNSMGGATALGVAVEHPGLIARLVLMGSAGLVTDVHEDLKPVIQYDFTREGMVRLIRALTTDAFVIEDALIDYRFAMAIDPDTRRAYAATMGWIREQNGLFYPETYIRQNRVPTLVVNGKNDKVVPVANAYKFLELLDGIETRLKKQRVCLSRRQAPAVEPEAHCHSPFPCEHWDRCTGAKPADWIFHMPHLNMTRRAELKALGVESIAAIPDDFRLSARQVIIRDAIRSGKPFIAEDLSEHLDGFGPPAFYLDFEAFVPAIPLYPGTRPYQVIPFQWSLHQLDPDGKIRHQDFLAEADSDPRRPFAETLIAALKGTRLPIIVYSSYERARLTELTKQFPDLAPPLQRIIGQLADLLPVVRSGVYHPDFDFSASIKTAAPALCQDVTYDDLQEIADGGAASTAFWSMASGRTSAEMSERLRRSLREYCHRDTWAMVRLHQALDALAAPSG